mmetsp:Transcript_22889/g.52803  ORF Transcript_22889/g.52803 Transcript_22889/m.52803 type:complete len:217 (-) Transcript_22889:2395-3045(-)
MFTTAITAAIAIASFAAATRIVKRRRRRRHGALAVAHGAVALLGPLLVSLVILALLVDSLGRAVLVVGRGISARSAVAPLLLVLAPLGCGLAARCCRRRRRHRCRSKRAQRGRHCSALTLACRFRCYATPLAGWTTTAWHPTSHGPPACRRRPLRRRSIFRSRRVSYDSRSRPKSAGGGRRQSRRRRVAASGCTCTVSPKTTLFACSPSGLSTRRG